MTDQPQSETTNQHQRRTVVPGTAVCPYCSTLIEPEAETCPGCGAKKHVGTTTIQWLTTYLILLAFIFFVEHYNHWYFYYLSLSILRPFIGIISSFLVCILALKAVKIFCRFRFKNQIKWILNKKQKPIQKP